MCGIYSRFIFPWLCDWALNQPEVANHRRELLREVAGDVLEIGIGTGLNLACYPRSIRAMTAVEPNPGMGKRLLRRIAETGVEVDHREANAESVPFADHSFDVVVSTFTLCSIRRVEQVLTEVFRVLKPSGRFVFLEHGLSPEPGVQKWQRRLNPIQRILGGGCQLDLDVRQELTKQPFQSIKVDNFYLEHAPRTHGYLYRGFASIAVHI